MNAIDIVAAEPWLITEEGLRQILAIAERSNNVEALETRTGKRHYTARGLEVRDGIGIVTVRGPIFRYANMFTEISGATSTQMLARDLQQAADDVLVRGIVLNVDSPGGQAAGINELGELVYSLREVKPIVTYAGGSIASAAYWIGSAAEEIVIDSTSIAGSIGAKVSIVDTTDAEAKAGRKHYEIVSSQSPDKVLDIRQDEGRAKMQKIVDDLAAVFVEAVARNRDVSVETVLSTYGRGGVMVGRAAVEAGLADRLGSFEGLLAEMIAHTNPQRRAFSMSTPTRSTLTIPKGAIVVSTTDELRTALNAGHTADEISISTLDVDAIKATAKAEGIAEEQAKSKAAMDTARAEATTAERARIAGLQAVAAKGFEKDLTAAIEQGTSVEAYAVAQAKLQNSRGVSVTRLAADAPPAVAHATPGAAADSKGRWSNITARLNAKAKRAS